MREVGEREEVLSEEKLPDNRQKIERGEKGRGEEAAGLPDNTGEPDHSCHPIKSIVTCLIAGIQNPPTSMVD